jgi:hypothetical protein
MSAFGTKRTSESTQLMSAFGGKADMSAPNPMSAFDGRTSAGIEFLPIPPGP